MIDKRTVTEVIKGGEIVTQEAGEIRTLGTDELRLNDAYWRAANCLSVGQIYLYDNPLLQLPLSLSNIQPTLLDRWGMTTVRARITLAELEQQLHGPQTGYKNIVLKRRLKNKLIEHRQHIRQHGQATPEIRNWHGTGTQ